MIDFYSSLMAVIILSINLFYLAYLLVNKELDILHQKYGIIIFIIGYICIFYIFGINVYNLFKSFE